MTAQTKPKSPTLRPITLAPWIVALSALVLYGLTLNHWVTFTSLPFASMVSGWDWHPLPLAWRPSVTPPLLLVLTLPVRLLPAAMRPLGLNIFTAICASLVLAILARSVRLMPHDRTREQRQREGGAYALLSLRPAFLPAVFAVLILAVQMTFWENAVAMTTEMISLLVFAFLILCLLEFRISHNERHLGLFAFVYGLGVANDWALIGFFPCFLVALIWIKGFGFFNWRFILRIAAWGTIGLLLYLLVPMLGAAAGDGSFGDLLHMECGDQSYHLRTAWGGRFILLMIGAPSLLPVLFAAIKWPSFEGEVSAGGHNITRVLFQFLHVVFLALSVVMFLDLRFSPSPRKLGLQGCLTFYYLGALSIGYFSGYNLLVCSKDPAFVWGRPTGFLRMLNRLQVVILWIATFALPGWLFAQNLPAIRGNSKPVVSEFAGQMAKSLPVRPTIVLADDIDRRELAAGAVQRLGISPNYIFIDTQSLGHREYLQFLYDHYPSLHKSLVDPTKLPTTIPDTAIVDLVTNLVQHGSVYYLHPSFGYYFERIYTLPHRLGNDVSVYPNDGRRLAIAVPSTNEIAENRSFWNGWKNDTLPGLLEQVESGVDAMRVAYYYSQLVNAWAVTEQTAATQSAEFNVPLLKEAGEWFETAVKLYPKNQIAQINRQYNAKLLRAAPVPGSVTAADLMAAGIDWPTWMIWDGPPDEPDLNVRIGGYMATRGDIVQAAHLFQRALQLRPGDVDAEMDMAKTYIRLGMTEPGFELLRRLHSQTNSIELVRIEAWARTRTKDYPAAEKLMLDAYKAHPGDPNMLGVLFEFYRGVGYEMLRAAKDDAAQQAQSTPWFRNALRFSDELVQLLNSPASHNVGASDQADAFMKKAEIQMLLKDWAGAVATLSQAEPLMQGDPYPILNRAICHLQLNKLDSAKADYLAVEKMLSESGSEPSYVAYYGLSQVAGKQKDTATQIHYDRLYLKSAPTNTTEFATVARQLQQLEGR